ncbi:hypothetical protein NDU88_006990 [Pleurodeles waltl]|uniref:Uncharacterized protein n=1 Tax=Pleurodeles waltl TaxID=8319 RepID=A0AAV7WFS5_PLEWA|nr:hypothetical protein NDU88_006989 [Pleurodeles waltl]KAJ1211632.1 hypothetical protein NDU88_006990 [Pleurodeles waltl]
MWGWSAKGVKYPDVFGAFPLVIIVVWFAPRPAAGSYIIKKGVAGCVRCARRHADEASPVRMGSKQNAHALGRASAKRRPVCVCFITALRALRSPNVPALIRAEDITIGDEGRSTPPRGSNPAAAACLLRCSCSRAGTQEGWWTLVFRNKKEKSACSKHLMHEGNSEIVHQCQDVEEREIAGHSE